MTGKIARTALAVAAMASAVLPLASQAQARPGWNGGGWGGNNWGGGGRGWHRDRGVDGGDVLAGILIIGGIAAIASAASNAQRDRDVVRNNDYRYRSDDGPRDDYRRDNWPTGNASGQGQGADYARRATSNIDDAVNRCVDEASRKGEVDEVYDASRSANGYRVSGTLRNGDRFSCDINGEGGVLLDLRRGAM